MSPKRALAALAALVLLSPGAALAAHRETDDPDLVYEAGIGDLSAARATLNDDDKPDIANDQGETGLMRAAEHGHLAIVKLLLDHGAVINRPDQLGKSALIWAAEGGDAETIDWLIKAGARLEQATKDGITPLMAAARKGQAAAVTHLLAAGAQPDRSDFAGRDSLSWAKESRDPQVIELIRKAQKH